MNLNTILPTFLTLSQVEFDNTGIAAVAGLLACGLIVIGAAIGIGNLASKATEAIARQPEAGGRIFTCMIISAAFIEGFTLLALIICLISVTKV